MRLAVSATPRGERVAPRAGPGSRGGIGGRRVDGRKTGRDRTIELLRADLARVREQLEQANADYRHLLARFEQLDAPSTGGDLSTQV